MFNGVEEKKPVVGFQKEEILGDSRSGVGLYRPENNTRFRTDQTYFENTSRAPPDHLSKIRRKQFRGLTSSKS